VTTTGTRPAWTITETADRCGVSRSTVRRYRETGKFPNAFKTTTGEWKIPLPDLLAVGWKPNGASPEPDLGSPAGQPAAPMAERIRELEQALAGERARADAAERLAASFRQNSEDLRIALRMLEAGKVSSPEPPRPEPVEKESVALEPALSSPGQARPWRRLWEGVSRRVR
jgi:hypothetical protein